MILNCNYCGGELEIRKGETVTTCKYCRTAQTLPVTKNDGAQNLFNRASALRRRCDFDKAEALYEKILETEADEAEAYWGLVLCRYGIEYVEDPQSGKMLPTCHRVSYDAVVADEDYRSAIENADGERRALYEKQAREIDAIQKDILAIAREEEAYDIFLCYKETDESGKRTRDSAIANDIYYQLTDEGYKVFYAAITLEGKLGSAYEPIIFSALNSARVMLVIGTKPEYFNAVWVKNEWSRYLKIIKKDRSKLLIPCYRDMDAYDLPDEFAHLQAQNMDKIGFITDIIRGIKKVMERSAPKEPAVVKETVREVIKETVIKEPASVLLPSFDALSTMPPAEINKRALMYCKELGSTPDDRELNTSLAFCYLKLKLYDKALACFEKATDGNYEDAEAYFYAAAALLKGKKAFLTPRAVIDKIEEYIQAAIMINPKGIYYYLWAYIRYDHHFRKSYRMDPNYQALLLQAKQHGVSTAEITKLYGVLGLERPSCL